jgi:hypothetical protein
MNPPSESGLNHLNQILILVGAIHHAGISPLPMEARYPAVKALSATGRRAGQDSDHPWFLWWGGCTQMQMAPNFCCPVVYIFGSEFWPFLTHIHFKDLAVISNDLNMEDLWEAANRLHILVEIPGESVSYLASARQVRNSFCWVLPKAPGCPLYRWGCGMPLIPLTGELNTAFRVGHFASFWHQSEYSRCHCWAACLVVKNYTHIHRES